MKRKRFNLESVYQYRRQIEEARREEVALRSRILAEMETALEGLSRRKHEAIRSLPWEPDRPVDPRLFDLHAAYLRGLEARIAKQRARVAEAQQQWERRRQALLEVSREKRIVERLREKAHRKFLWTAGREEQRDLDETAGRRALRGGNGEG